MKVVNYFSVYPSYTYISFTGASDASLQKLRELLYNQVEGYAFDAMVVNKNIGFTREEIMMDYINFLLLEVPANPKPISTPFGTYYGVFKLKVKGDKVVMSDDIKETNDSNGFTILKDQPLFWLRENEEIDLLLYIGKGRGSDHVKFRPVVEAGRVVKGDPFYVSYLINHLGLKPGTPEYETEIDKVTNMTIRVEMVNPFGPSAIDLVQSVLEKV